jgi:hypothetical protein
MNTTNQTLRFLGLGSILALALSIAPSAARAGGNLPPDAWRRATPVTNSTDIKPGDTVIMACPGCKTVMITERRILPDGKAGTGLYTIGSKHECDICGGAITTLAGKTADMMQHNCSMCGQNAAFCCVAPAVDRKT